MPLFPPLLSLRLALALVLALLAGPVLAGPWPRAEDATFLSLSAERDREDNSYISLYGEYGMTPRSTLGFELGHASAGENSVILWLQRALDDGEGQSRLTVSLGAGMLERDGVYLPVGQIGGAWGRGWDSIPGLRALPGGGWVGLEARVKVAGAMKDQKAIERLSGSGAGILSYITPETTTKAELTLGWHALASTMLIQQLQFEDRDDTGFSSKLSVSAVRDLAGPAKIELGVIAPLSGKSEPAVKLGTWFQF
ncbi:MAG: hypothetical protein QM682_01290 [Paracoccus sp. (in: a-proteobacteria)]|uniref:hypothetical protein n=1 Tax=Paracoccus sp. TaxID=267 RepID=UPI0039E30543